MKRSSFTILSVVFDVFLVNAAFVLAFLIRFSGTLPAYNFSAYLILALPISLIFIGCCWVNDLYNPITLVDVWTIVRKVAVSVTIATLLVMVIAFLGGDHTASLARLSLVFAYILALVLLALWRYLFMRFGSIRWPLQTVLIYGSSKTAFDLAIEIEKRLHRGWKCEGIVLDCDRSDALEGFTDYVLGERAEVITLLKKLKPTRLIIASPDSQRELIEEIALDNAIHANTHIDVVPALYEVFLGEFDSTLGDIPLVRVADIQRPGYFSALKRLIDIMFGVLGLVVASPILFVAFIAVKLDDRGPFFYRQERVGKNEKLFKIYKVRTMKTNAEELSGPVLATDDDPRITRVGRVLRTYRVDEIPQLLNIINGDMSFVGPRPEREFFVKEFIEEIPGYRERFAIKPGATGLAQINGGYATDAARKLKYDLIYLYHRSIGLDLKILVDTAKVVFTGKGAR